VQPGAQCAVGTAHPVRRLCRSSPNNIARARVARPGAHDLENSQVLVSCPLEALAYRGRITDQSRLGRE
jgi:hypothetical protein